jgi:hypothetical protein
VAFLRRVLTADKEHALRTRKIRDFTRQPCPRCGKPCNGAFGSPMSDRAAATVGHGDRSNLDGCDLTAVQWTALSDGGPTDESLARIADLESKLAIVELCAPPLIETTGPYDAEKTFIPGEGPPWGLPVLKLLTTPYTGDPEYQANHERWGI